MSILNRLFRNKPTELNELNKKAQKKIYDEYEVYQRALTFEPVANYYTPPLKRGCEYCGNQSRVSDGRGNCASCGAPLPKIKETVIVSYTSAT